MKAMGIARTMIVIGIVAIAMLAAESIVFESNARISRRLFVSALTMTLCGVCSVVFAVAIRQRTFPRTMATGTIISLIAMLVWWIRIWFGDGMDREGNAVVESIATGFTALAVVGVFGAFIALVPPVKRVLRVGRVVAFLALLPVVGISTLLGVVHKLDVLNRHRMFSGDIYDMGERLGMFGIGLLAVGVGIMHLVGGSFKRNVGTYAKGHHVVEACCPRCGQQCSLQSGGDSCSTCGLVINIEVIPT